MKSYEIKDTELLYWDDSYANEFEATIIDVTETGIVLDKTLFYPFGGGQVSDIGFIIPKANKNMKIKVSNVENEGGKIIHFIQKKDHQKLKPGEKIIGKIDWERRYKIMKGHTSQHILSALILDKTGIMTTKAVLDASEVAIYLSEKISGEELSKIIVETNKLLLSGKKIESSLTKKKELTSSIKNKLRGDIISKDIEELRIVTVQDTDLSLCGGTHIKNTKEIGIIALTDFKGDIIHYSIGDTALANLTQINLAFITTAKQLAVKPKEVGSRITKALDELGELRKENSFLTKIAMKSLIEEMKKEAIMIGSVEILTGDFQFAEKKFVLQELGELSDNNITILNVRGPILVIVSSSKVFPANNLISAFCEKTKNKGGGTPTIAQAGMTNSDNSLEIILEIIREKIDKK
ncbi:MAG: alanine--tRNA ligase-related protein [Candidatus Heimdallarchaeota archaeon]